MLSDLSTPVSDAVTFALPSLTLFDLLPRVCRSACMVFELITGDCLFDPKADDKGTYSRDEGPNNAPSR